MKKFGTIAVAVMLALGACAAAHAEMGVGVTWEGDGVTPNMVLPIKMQSGLIIEPEAGISYTDFRNAGPSDLVAGAGETQDPSLTTVRIGLGVSKAMREGTSPLFGARVLAEIHTVDDVLYSSVIEYDNWTDFSGFVYVGGQASLGENIDIVGGWGPGFDFKGEIQGHSLDEEVEDIVIAESSTKIATHAFIKLRWWVWGM